MKLKATSTFLALGLAVIVSAASLAHAQNGVAPYSSFHVERVNTNQYAGAESCLTESWGAILNQCSYSVDLVFSLPAAISNGLTVTVEAATTYNTPAFSCILYAITGDGNSGSALGSVTFQQMAQPAGPPTPPTLSPRALSIVASIGNGRNVQLICWGVPAGAEITNLTWN